MTFVPLPAIVRCYNSTLSWTRAESSLASEKKHFSSHKSGRSTPKYLCSCVLFRQSVSCKCFWQTYPTNKPPSGAAEATFGQMQVDVIANDDVKKKRAVNLLQEEMPLYLFAMPPLCPMEGCKIPNSGNSLSKSTNLQLIGLPATVHRDCK